MKRIVIDSSVGAKWYFEEIMKPEADLLMEHLRKGEISAIVPEIFYPEMANICRKRVRLGQMDIGDALETFGHVMRLPLKSYSDQELADVALENALRFGISVYDGLYLALSEVYVAPFVTADEELCKRCHKRFDFIEFLGTFNAKT